MISQTRSTQSCCGPMPATAQFASLSKSTSFKAAHLEPHPFTLTGQRGSMVHFPCQGEPDGAAYLVKASSKTDKYVLMIHEWWGLNDYIKKEAERLQQELGDVNVMAIDLYDGKVASTRDKAAEYMNAVDDARCRKILNGAKEFVGPQARVCTIGWCFGGGWSLQATLALGTNAAGCIMYYGMPETDDAKIASLHVPVLFILATKDGWITPKLVHDFESKMKEAGKSITVKAYDAEHAFANPSNPIYNKTFADDAHKESVAFLKKQLE